MWQQVANATGAKFDAYLPEGSVASMQQSLANAVTLAHQGILNFIEGGNEEDQPYATGLGNSLAQTASYQQTVYNTAHSLGLKAINMSFGTGWSNPTGDYGTVGNLAASADFANAHTYFGTGNTPSYTISVLNSDAQLAANGKPVITTEMGWYTTASTTDVSNVTVTEQAKYMLDGLLDAYQQGDAKTYLYELMDQSTGGTNNENNFGLFYSNGTPKPAATALHNLTSLLADNGATAATFTPTALAYQLTGTIATDNSLLMEKSDGSFWLAVWNEARLSGPNSPAQITVANHNVTLNLGANAQTIEVFDPMTGTTAVQTVSNVSSVTLSLPDHPVLVEIIPGTSSTGTTGSTGSTGSTTPPVTTPPSTTATASDLAILVPAAAETAATSATTVLTGVSISDAWAAGHAGSMALNITAGSGTVNISNGASILSASNGATLHLSGNLAQLNADLGTLSYVGGGSAGTDHVTVNVWNQGGVSATSNVGVTVSASTTGSTGSTTGSTGSTGTTAPTSQDLAITLPSTTAAMNGTAMTAIAGVSINDPWAANHGGSMALNLSVGNGMLEINNGSGMVTGSSLTLTGSLATLNSELSTLQYEAKLVGIDTLSVNVWNQGGVSVTQLLHLTSH